jgi:archaemetzincin
MAAANIQTVFGLPAAVMPPWARPDYAYLANRRQYDVLPILKKLGTGRRRPGLRVAITAADLCLPILTYVFGEARVGGHLAVASLFRLSQDPDGSRVSPARLYERLIKVVLHETAHALGLGHCQARGCLMNFSAGLEHLDALDPNFCPECLRDLAIPVRTLIQETGYVWRNS